MTPPIEFVKDVNNRVSVDVTLDTMQAPEVQAALIYQALVIAERRWITMCAGENLFLLLVIFGIAWIFGFLTWITIIIAASACIVRYHLGCSLLDLNYVTVTPHTGGNDHGV